MYDHARSKGHGCIFIFVFVFIIGNLIMLNLFLAILLKNFEEPLGKEEVVNSGPSVFVVFKQMVVSKISKCC